MAGPAMTRLAMTLRSTVWLLAATLLCASTGAFAQAAPKTLSLGDGKSNAPLLTRDELRACLQRQTSLNQQRETLQRDNAAHDTQRAAIEREGEALKAERAQIDRQRQAVDDLSRRTRELNDRVADWNARSKQFNESNRTGPMADRQRRQLETERKQIEADTQALQADQQTLVADLEKKVAAYNERARARDAEAEKWNAGNAALSGRSQALQTERDLWLAECGNRRYREDDEIAIRRGS